MYLRSNIPSGLVLMSFIARLIVAFGGCVPNLHGGNPNMSLGWLTLWLEDTIPPIQELVSGGFELHSSSEIISNSLYRAYDTITSNRGSKQDYVPN